jgi:hypothetical protein
MSLHGRVPGTSTEFHATNVGGDQLKVTTVVCLWIVLLPFLFTGGAASAATFTEVGDAGGTPGTAQITVGTGALNTIFGTLSPATDTDVFRIFITNPDLFSITMAGTSLSSDNDTELYVLDAAGNLVFSDDDGGAGLLSQVNAGALAGRSAGFYLVAYNLFNSSAIGTPVTGWTVSPSPSQTGAVQLNFTNAEFAAADVPEPASLVLTGAGALALLGCTRLRRRPR